MKRHAVASQSVLRPPSRETSFSDLREENRQLRELVIQLSKLVIKNVAERG